MVTLIWGSSDTAHPSEGLNPEDSGWEKVNGVYRPVWFDGPPLPENLRNDENPEAEESEEQDNLDDVQKAEWSDSSGEEKLRLRLGCGCLQEEKKWKRLFCCTIRSVLLSLAILI